MPLLLFAILGVALAAAILAFCLRRRSDDHSGEALGLGKGSNLSTEPDRAANDATDNSEEG